MPRLPVALLLLAGLTACGAPSQAQRPQAPGPLAPGEHHAVLDGVRLWYRVAGEGAPGAAPVLFLHGGPGAGSHDFATVAGPGLERGLRMVYLDQRGAGRSERPWSGAYSVPVLVEDVERLRVHLGVERLSLVGHSFGALLALEYAARFPERVARLVYVEGFWNAPAQCRGRRERLERAHPEATARVLAAARAEGRTVGDCDLEFQVLKGAEREAFNDAGVFRDAASRERQAQLAAQSGTRNTGEVSRALFKQGLLEYRFEGAARVRAPTLVLIGKHSGVGALEPQRELARLLPDARLVEYEESAHFLYLDETERFVRDVTAFLAGAR